MKKRAGDGGWSSIVSNSVLVLEPEGKREGSRNIIPTATAGK